MPGIIKDTPFKTISVKELHPTFGAEIEGVDFENLSQEQFDEIKAALAKYGVCVFRNTGMDDDKHVEFSRRFGELDDIKRYMQPGAKLRYKYYELFDAGNVDENGQVVDPESTRAHYNRGNLLWHVDSSFNPRRASMSILRAYELPPAGTGGDTEFADSRSAFDALPEDLKQELLSRDYVAAHSHAWSRKKGSPDFFKELDPTGSKMARHRLVQRHEPSGRMNIYTAAHAHHVEGLSQDESDKLLDTLAKHVTQPRFVLDVAWQNPTDLIIWDNTCVMHRAAGGSFEGKYRRDLRRTTVHDDSPTAWGLNEKDFAPPGLMARRGV
ncbi:alpha-ketoglutarate-dependent 2,4-dichlorophenoxyacetate dioxygenase [Lineolata rhizophorae]|uniref:Alpha-ketoglutarate-dependent 2,4-dichlorophenoxyacetate dioxygenase n=1 Tax=Lineolata rhizophorae TaxID=578093 RepID=A0A6A6NR34_9PEZI|nr:alpha-ketoglutarate-dependent 2,4-dichlorophenoxyacetate dioxygenase [Lineolata rhizophorae]